MLLSIRVVQRWRRRTLRVGSLRKMPRAVLLYKAVDPGSYRVVGVGEPDGHHMPMLMLKQHWRGKAAAEGARLGQYGVALAHQMQRWHGERQGTHSGCLRAPEKMIGSAAKQQEAPGWEGGGPAAACLPNGGVAQQREHTRALAEAERPIERAFSLATLDD